MQYWGYGTGFNPGFTFLGFVFHVLFWGLIIMLIFKFFKHGSYRHCCGHEMNEDEEMGDRSLEIIKERYAKGEIDKKEFEQLKKDLS